MSANENNPYDPVLADDSEKEQHDQHSVDCVNCDLRWRITGVWWCLVLCYAVRQ